MERDERAFGLLCDYWTGDAIRAASNSELMASEADGGRGVIMVDGRACDAYSTCAAPSANPRVMVPRAA